MADNDRIPHHHLRAADIDRDAASAALGEHYASGRLTGDEHDERISAAWQARTYGDLAALFDDLPPPRWGVAVSDGTPTAYRPTPQAKPTRVRRVFGQLSTTVVPLLPVLIVVSVVLIMLFKGPFPLLLLAAWWWWAGWGRNNHVRPCR